MIGKYVSETPFQKISKTYPTIVVQYVVRRDRVKKSGTTRVAQNQFRQKPKAKAVRPLLDTLSLLATIQCSLSEIVTVFRPTLQLRSCYFLMLLIGVSSLFASRLRLG
jgi:hypothetical protein